MNLASLFLHIDEVIRVVKLGWVTVEAVVTSIKNGRATIVGADGQTLSAEDVKKAVGAAIAQAGVTGDRAGGRIDQRNAPVPDNDVD